MKKPACTGARRPTTFGPGSPADVGPSGYDALFVAEHVESTRKGGASTYNAVVLKVLDQLGYRVLTVCCARRLPGLVFRAPAADLRFLHATRVVGDWHVATSLPSILRAIKQMIVGQPVPNGSTDARIGGFPTATEIHRLERRLAGIRPRLAILDTLFRTPYAAVLSERTKRIVLAHDVFHKRCESFLRNGIRPLPEITAGRERDLLDSCDAVIAINRSDHETFREIGVARPLATLIPPVEGVAVSRYAGPRASGVLYIGSESPHNVDGLRWFLDTVWPAVVAAEPGALLHVVGGVCRSVEARSAVVLHGRVDDLDTLQPHVAFAVNPLRMGSGLKIKIVDYLALGLGVIGTPVAIEGFPDPDAADGPFEIAEDAEALAGALLRWLADPAFAERKGRNATGYVARHLGMESAVAAMTTLLGEVGVEAPGRRNR